MTVTNVPFDKDGNLVTYLPKYDRSSEFEMRPNKSFFATLKIIDTERGRSAAKFIWEDEQGRHYPMFMTDMLDLVKTGIIDCGRVTGHWIIKKRGANYGIGVFHDKL